MKVFISYSRIDASETANTIHTYLKECGHEVFIDTSDIRGGDEWRNTIEKNISDCDIFVLIVSRSAYRRPEVKKELELADNMKKRIIPCVNKRYVNYEDLSDNIKKYNGINFERLDDLIQELDYKIDLEIKDQGKTSNEVKTETNKDENYSPVLENQSIAKTTSIQEYIKKAKVFQRLKQYQKALKNYNEAIKLELDNFEAHFNKAQLLYNIGDFINALATIEKAIDLQPENADVWYHKGIILEKLEKYEEAIDVFNTDLYIDDKDVNSWTAKANILVKLERYEEAISCYNKVLEINPYNKESIKNKEIAKAANIKKQKYVSIIKEIKIFDINKDYSKVFNLSEQALELEPGNTLSYLYKGHALNELKKYKEAIQCYDKVLEIEPKNTEAMNKRKKIQEQLDKESVKLDTSFKISVNKIPVKVGEEYDVKIEAMSKRGDSGIAKIGRMIIFVFNTKEGDLVKIKIIRTGKGYATANVVQRYS